METINNDNHFNYIRMPELLAPVGGKSHLTAAVNSGADAVYMGGSSFNARIFADNFTDAEMEEAVTWAHRRGVKVYITLNTLVHDDELVRAFEYANYLYSIGVDALIVQDMGLARLIHKYLPDFPLHLSTQGTLYNKQGVALARRLGFTRVVPARELSVDEIREIVAAGREPNAGTASDNYLPEADVEVFVHGAMCMCYSGQCQMSRMLGGTRSGNRGTCAQPCRQPYTDDSGNTYYALSPKDQCQIENLPEIILAGVSSLKIEGRMKSPEYVAVVTQVYRKYIDLFGDLLRKYGPDEAARRYAVEPDDLARLRQIFSRGDFTEGYIHGNPGQDLLSGCSPKNQGIRIGRVVAVIDSENKAYDRDEKRAVHGALKRGKVLVCIAADRSAIESGGKAGPVISGDGLEFRSDGEQPGRSAAGGVATFIKPIGQGHYIIGDLDRGVETGDIAYKVNDRRLAEEALNVPDKRLPLTMAFTAREGQYPVLTATDVRSGYTAEISADHIVERARKAATDADRIESNLRRLGDTPYTPGYTGIDVQIDDDIMMPVSIVNRMRRDAMDELMAERTEGVMRGRHPLSRAELDVIESGEMLGADVLDPGNYPASITELTEDYAARTGIDKSGSNEMQASCIKSKPVPLLEYMERISLSGVEESKIPYILNVSKGNLDRYIEENFDEIASAAKDTGILIGNLGWIERFLNAGVRVYGDYGLNVYNEQARRAFEDIGVSIYMPSHETGVSDERGIPLMITEHPVNAVTLTDRKGAVHRVVTAPGGDKTLIY